MWIGEGHMKPSDRAREMYDQTWELFFRLKFNYNDSTAIDDCKKKTIKTINEVLDSRPVSKSKLSHWDEVKVEIENLIIN